MYVLPPVSLSLLSRCKNPDLAFHSLSWSHKETVFDLSSYTASTFQKVLTFANLKLPSSESETLQCFATNHRSENPLVPGVASSHDWGVPWSTSEGLKMDVWDAPVNGAWGKELDLGELRAFSEDAVRWEQAISSAEEARSDAEARGIVDKREEEGRQEQQVPDQQLACWSDLYWAVDTDNVFDERWGVWPAWEKVGRHLRFAKGLRDVAQEVGRKVLGQREKPFIAIRESPPFLLLKSLLTDFDPLPLLCARRSTRRLWLPDSGPVRPRRSGQLVLPLALLLSPHGQIHPIPSRPRTRRRSRPQGRSCLL